MKNKFKFLPILLSFLFIFVLFAGCGKQVNINEIDSSVKNVILFIGDGMGDAHIQNAKKYFDIDSFDFEKDYRGKVKTWSLSGTTDSAAAATALATGNKALNGEVGQAYHMFCKNIMEMSINEGKKTGIITTDELSGATPACFSSHTYSRKNTDDIIDDQIESDIDLLIGSSSSKYNENQFRFEEQGYIYSSNYNDIKSLQDNQKYIGVYDGLRSKYNENFENQTDIEAIIKYSLDFLDNENGFCLMIENAYIDKCSHSNDFYGMACEVREFADMINEAYKFITNRNDTLIMITADHETGGLKIAQNKEDLNNKLFSKTGHTGTNVNFYSNIVLTDSKVIENTDIFRFSKKVIVR